MTDNQMPPEALSAMDVDVAAYRRVAKGHNIKLHPCFDDHHATDGYRYPTLAQRDAREYGENQVARSRCYI